MAPATATTAAMTIAVVLRRMALSLIVALVLGEQPAPPP